MKNTLFVIALFSCFISANAQVRPDQAIEKTTAEDTDEIYSQYNGLLRRIKFSNAKTYFQQGVVDSIALLQDSIIVVFKSGVETHRDTIAGIGGGGGGTDDQTLSFVGTTLSIEGANSVDLSSLQDGTGTDDQTIDVFSLAGTTLSLSLENDGQAAQTVDLSSLGGSSVWTESSGDIYYNSGDVGIGTTTPSALLHTVGGDVIFDSGASGFKSYRFLFNGTEIGGITTKSSRFSLYGGTIPSEHLHISTVGDIGINTVTPTSKIDILDGGDYQINIRRSATILTRFRSTPEGALLISNSTDNGSTYASHFILGGADVEVADDTDINGAYIHANAIVTLSDITDDSNTSDYTIQAAQEVNGMTLLIECDNTSGDFSDDGCAIETAGSTQIENASNYVFSSNKIVTLRYSATKGMWRILNQ
jgi:hypothetical protein